MSAKNIDDQDFENQSNDSADSSYDEPYEDDAVYSEDDADQWSDDVELSDEDDTEADQPAPKKKSSNLMIGVILFVIIIAVFGFMALSGAKKQAPEATPEPQTAINAETESDTAATPDADQSQTANITDLKNQEDQTATGDQSSAVPAPTPAPVTAAPQQGLMDNPDMVGQNSNENTAPEQAPLTAPNANSVPVPTLTTESTPDGAQPPTPSKDVVAAIAPTVKPVSDFPTVDSIKKPETNAPEVVAPVAENLPVITETIPVVKASAQEDKSGELQGQLTTAQNKILSLQKQLVDQTTELAAQKQKVASASSNDSTDTEVEDLKAKISELESKLAAKPTAKPVKIVAERDESSYETEDRSVDQTSVIAPAKKAPVIATKPQVVAKQWSLKSAGTGKAILANKATGDLKTVRVGDTVIGLGRIISISSNNSSWVVKGTAGSVSE